MSVSRKASRKFLNFVPPKIFSYMCLERTAAVSQHRTRELTITKPYDSLT